jgi:SAM-dependent methyltransferase
MIFWVVGLAILLLTQFVVLFLGAPYVPTLHKQREEALDLLNLKKGQTLIDLGSGDGALLRAAAERGLKAVGYEINPFLVFVAWARTRRYDGRVKLVWGNFWKKKWPPADGVFVFLTDRYMKKLDENMQSQFAKPVKLVTYGFKLYDREPTAKKGACFLYRY